MLLKEESLISIEWFIIREEMLEDLKSEINCIDIMYQTIDNYMQLIWNVASRERIQWDKTIILDLNIII